MKVPAQGDITDVVESKSMSIEGRVRRALEDVIDPCSVATGVPLTLEQMGLVKRIASDGERARLVLRLTSPMCLQVATILAQIDEALRHHGCDEATSIVIDEELDWNPNLVDADARRRLRALRPVGPVTTGT